MAIINIYQGAVTEGGVDGDVVSINGSMTAPIDIALDPSINEMKVVPLAIRTERGYKTSGTTIISDSNDTSDRWKLSWSADGPFTDSIQTDVEITAINKLFFARASSDSSETLLEDTSVSLSVTTKIVVT